MSGPKNPRATPEAGAEPAGASGEEESRPSPPTDAPPTRELPVDPDRTMIATDKAPSGGATGSDDRTRIATPPETTAPESPPASADPDRTMIAQDDTAPTQSRKAAGDDRTRIASKDTEAAAGLPEPIVHDRTMIAAPGQEVPVPGPGKDSSALPAPMPTVVSEIAPALPSSAPARLVEPGTLINNNYRIEALISAGGMGEVYRAVNVFTGDPVAVKVILPELARDRDIIDLFRREARVLVQLRDDAIVSYHNFILDQGLDRYCLIMEFVEGAHLGSRIRSGKAMPDDQALLLMRRLAGGLRQAHARGVTHRDLSPDNIILRHDRVEEAVLIDFGIARSTELGDGLAGRFAGKFKYIAPEQLGHFDGVIGPPTDIYGLALLMVAVSRGKPLDMGDSVVTASDARQQIPDLDGLSHRVFPLIQHMLEPDPAARPGDMSQVIAMLDDPMRIPARYRLPLWTTDQTKPPAGTEITGVSESPFGSFHPDTALPPPPVAEPPARSRLPLPAFIGGGAALLLLAAAGGWFALRNPAAPPAPDVEPAPALASTLPPRDASSREGFLAELSLGPCTMAQRIAAGPQTGLIEVLSDAPVDAATVQNPYEEAFSTRPTVIEQRVTTSQCPVLDFANTLSGRGSRAPVIEPLARSTPTGFQLEAQVGALAGRSLWLALIAPDGAVYDLTGQSRSLPDGGVSLGAAIDLPQPPAEGAGSYLLLAVTTSQPLVAVAAAPAGASAETLLPAILSEMQATPEGAAAALSPLAYQTPPTAPSNAG
ncbi:serine/threonine-protein kinase [Paracoccus xiamenensis]|uniref:serine/threonine-protein kinase n=1 Tax=Paracoccus xiamenensis TaxID=2714901 RepID=UPI00140E3B02|nr:serine/threonine-protein kinase [Paracoccus xiamenensis]NHF73855.1 protein kinase [Paracoccus xiamenensis]